jgi:2'-5' RNA ligase
VAHTRWFWGIVARVDIAQDVLLEVAEIATPHADLTPQDHRTGHITLLYAPLRGRRAGDQLAEAVAQTARTQQAFDLAVAGLGEFISPDRTVAWLGIEQGEDALHHLRQALCDCERDNLPHRFVPHLTLLYGENATAYGTVRPALTAVAERTRLELTVDALWVAGFPQSGHPARDLRYVARVPLGG